MPSSMIARSPLTSQFVAGLFATTLLASTALFGCQKPPAGGITVYSASSPELSMASIDPESGVWQSAPWTGNDWLPFAARSQLQLQHNLGRTPRSVQVYIAFSQSLPRNPALASGDLARVVSVDDENVTVWNDTNGNYFARVVVY